MDIIGRSYMLVSSLKSKLTVHYEKWKIRPTLIFFFFSIAKSKRSE